MKKPLQISLITPPYHCGMIESAGVWMPLGLSYVAGALREAGFEAELYDAMSLFHDLPQIRKHVSDTRPDVVAVTACTPAAGAALDVIRAARETLPDAVTVMGGVHPSLMPEHVLSDPSVDYVVRGEGEETLPELLMCLTTGGCLSDVKGISYASGGTCVHTPDRPLITDLDNLPIAWDLLDWPIYYYRAKPGSRLGISSWSRGCTEACSFCSQQLLWRRTWRPRSPESVVAEVRMLKSRFGVDTLEVSDERPTSDRERWERILDTLIREDIGVELLVETRADDIVRDEDIIRKYKDAGVLHMYVGVESGRQDRLDSVKKNLSAQNSRRAIDILNGAGIITETSFLLGFPEDTPETVREAVDLAVEYSPDLAFFLSVTPWPYSDMFPEVADRVEVSDFEQYNLINPIIKPDAMTRQELSSLLSRAFTEFYSRKMASLAKMSEEKCEYMKRVAKLLMEESYLSEEVKMSLHPSVSARGTARPAVRGG